MPKRSAGIVVFKRKGARLEVLLVHPGGPFWKNKESGAWSIPKGEPEEGEELLSAARRELREEIGLEPQGDLKDLGTIQQKGGKTVHAWAIEVDPDTVVAQVSNSSPSCGSPFGMLQAPVSLFFQKGPPGCTSSTSSRLPLRL